MAVREVCFELKDHSSLQFEAARYFSPTTSKSRDAAPQAARLTEQFLHQNRRIFELLQIRAQRDYDGRDVIIRLESAGITGAVPLVSPISARQDFGLIVQPRFEWAGLGPMLAEMGWRVAPTPLKLPMLRRSERRVPPWVISLMVLSRMQALLTQLDRRFEAVTEERSAPKGSVQWSEYATRNLPRARFLAVPCSYPDLRDDRLLRGAIRHTLELQVRSLEGQRQHGGFVHRLMELAENLLHQVRDVRPLRPAPATIQGWLRRPMRHQSFLDGLQAIEWVMDERGLAGTSDLDGIPWTMPMDAFFEAWVETVLHAVARGSGGELKTGRRQQTTVPIQWDPPYLGSQRSLKPDLILQGHDWSLVVDAKYKRHWEELQRTSWQEFDAWMRDDHRHDLLQVLAYANLSPRPHTICCLAYPCTLDRYQSLCERGRLFHQADIPVQGRRLQLWLTAIPMHADPVTIAGPLIQQIRLATAQAA